jgi:hypothetical protein
VAQLQLAAKQQVQQQQQQKQQLLTQTKGQESAYQQIVAAKQKTAGQIRAELFALAGGGGPSRFRWLLRTRNSVPYHWRASAFILAILKQESNLGANIGQCYVTDLTTGEMGRARIRARHSRVYESAARYRAVQTNHGRARTRLVHHPGLLSASAVGTEALWDRRSSYHPPG